MQTVQSKCKTQNSANPVQSRPIGDIQPLSDWIYSEL